MAGRTRKSAADVGVIIAAGGTGSRFGGRVPKQFSDLGGMTVLRRTLRLFQQHPRVGTIVVVAPRAHGASVAAAAKGFDKVTRIVAGGAHRQKSVWNGLAAFDPAPAIVLVHDAVRPLVTGRVISAVIAAAAAYGAAVAGVQVRDTIAEIGRGGAARRTLDRARLRAVQTPQGFRFDLLMRSHRAARRAGFHGTDDASLVQRLRVPVRIVEGEERNIKITTRDDLRIARIFLK